MRDDRFSWKDGDVTWDKGFKTREQLIKEGKIKPDSTEKKPAKRPRRKTGM